MNKNTEIRSQTKATVLPLDDVKARRTAFVARFIVIRENKRSRAHRIIEKLSWEEGTTAEQLHSIIRTIFLKNGDNMLQIDKDLRRALSHANPAMRHFVEEYSKRATLNFLDALFDYERSNELLLDTEPRQKLSGWKIPK